ncbi:MAG: TMEM175 family protein [Dokdonella sp.]
MNDADLSQEIGFRMRGAQPTRIDAFVDAAFAFAVTLLIVSVGHVPSTVPDLIQAMRGVPAFSASFLLLARFWLSHRQWSRCYGLEDGHSVRLSLALVFVVLIYVYPLRMVANMTLAMLSGGALAEQSIEIHTLADLRSLYVAFASGYGAVVIIFTLLYRHALACADALQLTASERVRTRSTAERYLTLAGVALLSLTLALLLPAGHASMLIYWLPGMVYALIYPATLLIGRREKAALAAIAPTRIA